MFKYLVFTLIAFYACNLFAGIEAISIPTSARENKTVIFHCRVPQNYNPASTVKYRVIIFFGGRNTTGETEVVNDSWGAWCDKNDVFMVVPSYKNDDYWHPQRWSGNALLKAIAQLKKKYGNICDDKLLFYGASAGAQCSNLFPEWIPQKTRAYVSHASGVFHRPSDKMKNVAVLLTCGEADKARLISNHNFIKNYRKLGINVMWKSYPNRPHDVPLGSTYLAQEFLEYYHKAYANDLDQTIPILTRHEKAIFVGDDQDNVIYQTGTPEAENIYPEDRVYFTSKELADAWVKSGEMP